MSICILVWASQLISISNSINRSTRLDNRRVTSVAACHPARRDILTHQDAESHHGQKSLQEDPERFHQGAILAPAGLRTWSRGRGRVGDGRWTRRRPVSELRPHAGSTNRSHGTEELDNACHGLLCASRCSPAVDSQLIDTLSRTAFGERWWHLLPVERTLILLLQTSTSAGTVRR